MGKTEIFNKFLDNMPFACILLSESLEIKYINPVMDGFLSSDSSQEIQDTSFLKFIPKEEQGSFINYINYLKESQSSHDWQHLNIIGSDGQYQPIFFRGISNCQEFAPEGVYILAGMRNDWNNLQTSNLSIFDNTSIGIMILNHEGIIEDANQTFARSIKQEKKNLINKHFTQYFNSETIRKINLLLKSIRKKDRNLSKDVITITFQDLSHIILDISVAKIKDFDGHLTKFMIITEDITDKEDTHFALVQSEKLALTGRLAASLAHEINNPLQTSIGCLGLAEEMLGDNKDELKVYIRMAMEELQRSARIVKKLRELNRKSDPSEKSTVNLKEIIEDVLILTKNQLTDRDIVPLFPFQGEPPFILASQDQIQQVMLNLIMNAIDALPEGGNIYIDLSETHQPDGYLIKIRDTGQGIEPAVMKNLFDPFFTTKEEGLGLGLYISKRIIDDHKGTMRVYSEPGKGTEFSIWLPGLGIPETEE